MTTNHPLFRSPDCAPVRRVLGMQHRNLMLPQEGGYLLLEASIPPGFGSPLHVHERDSECIHVLAGELVMMDEMGERTVRPGDTCLLPAGQAHGFINRGSETARALVIATPGEAAHQFFDELDQLAATGPVDVQDVCEAARRHALRVCLP
jgi:uncharacterized cupin superfamily protein